MSDYSTITLLSRNIDCSTITADEFISAMFSDFLEAEELYNDLYIPEWESYKVRSFFNHMEWARKRATNFAEKKWKTEKKRTAYIESEVTKARKDYKWDDFYYSLSFFDFNVEPWRNGLSGSCSISYKELTPKSLESCYNVVKDNKYFKVAKGWSFTYKASENSFRTSFRPQIKLIVDSETDAQMKKDADNLAESIRKFYEGCSYWGD